MHHAIHALLNLHIYLIHGFACFGIRIFGIALHIPHGESHKALRHKGRTNPLFFGFMEQDSDKHATLVTPYLLYRGTGFR